MSAIVAWIAIAALALVGLDLVARPARHVRASADRVERGRAVPLEKLSHKLLPQFETAGAYRLIGLAIVIAAAALAWWVLG